MIITRGRDRGEQRRALADIHPAHRAQPTDSSDVRSLPSRSARRSRRRSTKRPEEAEQRRQQRQRRDHRERDRDRRGHARRRTGSSRRARTSRASRCRRSRRRTGPRGPEVSIASTTASSTRHAAQQRLPVAGDDEQRVVDADAEADQQRQLARERGHARSRARAGRSTRRRRCPATRPAVSSGSAIASSDPNTRNSTIAAATKPNASPVPSLLELPLLATWPSASNSTPSADAEVTLLTNDLASLVEILFGLLVERDVREGDLARGGDLRLRRRVERRLRPTPRAAAARSGRAAAWISGRGAASVTFPFSTAITI